MKLGEEKTLVILICTILLTPITLSLLKTSNKKKCMDENDHSNLVIFLLTNLVVILQWGSKCRAGEEEITV